MTLADRVVAAKERQGSLVEDKQQKTEAYREFRQRMIEAGIDVDSRFTIPLMQRIGHGYTPVPGKKHRI